jgi:pimeloyl-ACP methyl ester carboxylesterase
MFFSVECNEEVPFLDRALIDAQASGSDPIRRGIARDVLSNVRICAQWPSGRGAAKENLPVPLSVPTMVFNGQFDLQTPPQTGRMLAASAPRARGVDFPAIGHIALLQSPACAIAIVADFQRRQDAPSVDASCVAELPEAEWKTALDAGFYSLLNGG